MKLLEQVLSDLSGGRFSFSRHAFRRVIERNISEQEIREAGAKAELIESYPDDKYSPSALLLGFTVAGRPLHFQIPFDDSEMSKIITIYQPDPSEWVEFRKRGGHV